MKENTPHSAVPANFCAACVHFKNALLQRPRLSELDKSTFLQAWFSLFYIAPTLHPDEFNNVEGGWPEGWKIFAKEAFRRASAKQLSDDELYPWEVQNAALQATPYFSSNI